MPGKFFKGVLFFVLFFTISVFAEITDADKALQPEPAKGGSDAVIILKKVTVDDTYEKNLKKDTFYLKLKVFTRKGIEDLRKVKLTYNPAKEEIKEIKAIVWTPDNKIYKLKSADIIKKSVSKKWGKKVTEISFAFPGLTEGSVIEYSYIKTRKYIREINYLYSQGTVFTKKCEFNFIANSKMTWGYTGMNLHQRPELKESKEKDKKIVHIVFTDIPGLPKEEYSYPYNTLREQIVFYYTYIFLNPAYFWQENGRLFFESQGRKFLKANGTIKRILKKEIGIKGKSDEQILRDIYDYVLTHYKPIDLLTKDELEKIDKKYLRKMIKADIKVKKIVKLPYLQQMQIDFLTMCFVKNAIPDSKVSLGLYVPWNEGRFVKTLRTFSQFEDDLIKVECGGKKYYLAPGKGMLPFGFVPYGARNTEIMFINENGVKFEKLKDVSPDKVVTKSVCEVNMDDEKMTFKVTETLNPYESFDMKGYALFFDKKEFKELLEEVLKQQYGDEAKLINFSVKNKNTYSKPFILEYEFSYPYEFEELGDNILFKPLLVPRYVNNPFAVDKRYSKIVFKYPEKKYFEITYHLPEDIVIDTLPEGKTVTKMGVTYKTEYQKIDDGSFKVKVFEEKKYSIYPKSAIWQFRSLFDKLIDASNPKVVLRETE